MNIRSLNLKWLWLNKIEAHLPPRYLQFPIQYHTRELLRICFRKDFIGHNSVRICKDREQLEKIEFLEKRKEFSVKSLVPYHSY